MNTTGTLIPTESVIRKIIELVGHGLPAGLGEQEPGKMCVEACVNAAFGLPHNDDPPCVHRAVRAAKIVLNDSHWSDNQARGKGMLKLAVAQVGSENIDGLKFAEILVKALPGLRERHPARDDRECKKFTLRAEARAITAESYIADAKHNATSILQLAQLAAEIAAVSAGCTARASADVDACLSDFADVMLDALDQCDAPGMKWLPLIDENRTS